MLLNATRAWSARGVRLALLVVVAVASVVVAAKPKCPPAKAPCRDAVSRCADTSPLLAGCAAGRTKRCRRRAASQCKRELRRCCRGLGVEACCAGAAGTGGFPGNPTTTLPGATTTTTPGGPVPTTSTTVPAASCSASSECGAGECCVGGRCCTAGVPNGPQCSGGYAAVSCCLSQKQAVPFDVPPGTCNDPPADCPLQTDCSSYYNYVCGHCLDDGKFFSGFCNVVGGSPCSVQ